MGIGLYHVNFKILWCSHEIVEQHCERLTYIDGTSLETREIGAPPSSNKNIHRPSYSPPPTFRASNSSICPLACSRNAKISEHLCAEVLDIRYIISKIHEQQSTIRQWRVSNMKPLPMEWTTHLNLIVHMHLTSIELEVNEGANKSNQPKLNNKPA